MSHSVDCENNNILRDFNHFISKAPTNCKALTPVSTFWIFGSHIFSNKLEEIFRWVIWTTFLEIFSDPVISFWGNLCRWCRLLKSGVKWLNQTSQLMQSVWSIITHQWILVDKCTSNHLQDQHKWRYFHTCDHNNHWYSSHNGRLRIHRDNYN
jgi:hypothetical protein